MDWCCEEAEAETEGAAEAEAEAEARPGADAALGAQRWRAKTAVATPTATAIKPRTCSTSLNWKCATLDEPEKNLYEVLKDAVVALDDEDCLFASRRDEAGELIQRLKRSHPQSFPSLDVDYSDTFEQKSTRSATSSTASTTRRARPTPAPAWDSLFPSSRRWRWSSALRSVAPVASSPPTAASRSSCSLWWRCMACVSSRCAFRLLSGPRASSRRTSARRPPDSCPRLPSVWVLLSAATTLVLLAEGQPDAWTAPLFLFRPVLLKALGLAGDTQTYHQQTFMARMSGVGLRLPFYVMIYSLNVFMFCVRAYPAVYQLAADCFFGRMAAGLRPLWMATNALFEGEGTVGHDFLRWSYVSGAELREVVGLMGPGGTAHPHP